jgi:hypothetical protein
MGAKTCMLVYANGDVSALLSARPTLDREQTRALVTRLHPRCEISELRDGTLHDDVNPPEGQVYAGCFPGITVVCSSEIGLDHPSQLDPRFLDVAEGHRVYLHAMHSVVDWFAYAVWTDGKLTRALSLSPDSGILEDVGQPLPFESQYWAGDSPVEQDADEPTYPLPFHPLEMAESALRSLFGFNYEGLTDQPGDPDLDSITLAGFAIRPASVWRRLVATLRGTKS